jgi:1,2-diacylglycerol 3-alpha-glucosyltransferase
VKILITSTTYPPAFNGQSTFTANLAEGLAARGHEVWVVTPSDYGKPYQVDHNGVHIYTVRATEIKFLHNQAYATLLPFGEVRQVFKHFQPDIVHLHDHYPLSQSIRQYARWKRLPVMGTNHFVPENLAPYIPLLPRLWPLFSRLLWWWMKLVYNHLDLVTAPSVTAANILKTQGLRTPVVPVSCGVSFERFHVDSQVDRGAVRRKYMLNESQTTFLFVGRVDSEKKVDVLIRAVNKLSRSDIQLVVTGVGAALNKYQELAEHLGILDRVHFTGFVGDRDLPRLLNSVDIFCMPSEAELLSIASLEAMATGRPLLVARSKALPELVSDGVNGYTFEAGNVEDAARCMALLADHPERWAEMGAASLARVQDHSLEHVIPRYEELYASCIKNCASPKGD